MARAPGVARYQILENRGRTVDASATLMRLDAGLRLLLLSTMSVLAPACATSAGGGEVVRPRPGLTAADYYPLTDGWKWAFDVEQEGMNILATYVVLERKGGIAVVQAGDERLTYVVTPDGVAQFEGNAIGDYIIKNPIQQNAEWPVAGGRARIVVGERGGQHRLARPPRRMRDRRGDADGSGARDANGVRARSGAGRPRDAGAGRPEVRDQGAGAAAAVTKPGRFRCQHPKIGPGRFFSHVRPMVGMFGPDEGEPQTGDGGAGRRAVRLQRRFHAVQPLGDSRTPATTSTPAPAPGAAPRARTGAPRAHVSEEEAQKAHPELPPDRRALLVTGEPGHPEERWIDAEAAEGAGYTLVDLSDDWTPFIFAEQMDGRTASRCPTATAASSSAWPTTSSTRTASRCEPGRQELPRALRHSAVAVGAARALRAGRTAPLPRSGERRRDRGGRDRHLRRARRPQEGRAAPGEDPRRAGEGARARRTSRRWRSWPRSSRRSRRR